MKWICLIIICNFSILTFGQDMKIGFLDSDALMKEMKEVYYFDSLQKVILKQNTRLGIIKEC